MHEVHLQQRFAAPPEKVFAAITDHEGMSRWIDGATITLEKKGTPAPNGLGAIRKIRARGTTVFEEVVLWDEPRAMDYKVLRGGPIRDHRGEIRLDPDGSGGTVLDYRIRFRIPWYFGGSLLGGLLRKLLGAEIGKGLKKLSGLL